MVSRSLWAKETVVSGRQVACVAHGCRWPWYLQRLRGRRRTYNLPGH